MKSRHRLVSFVALAVALFSQTPVSHAEGSGAHGGDVVACFSKFQGRHLGCVDDGRIVPCGDWSMQRLGLELPLSLLIDESIVTNEFQKLPDSVRQGAYVRALSRLSYEEALAALTALLVDFAVEEPRDLRTLVRGARDYFGDIASGYPSPEGLHDVQDSEDSQVLPEGCELIQVVTRQVDRLNYYPLIWNRMPSLQRALLQFHEQVYFVGVDKFEHSSSGYSQLLIQFALEEATRLGLKPGQSLPGASLLAKVIRYHFN